jgi:hypothetical protein
MTLPMKARRSKKNWSSLCHRVTWFSHSLRAGRVKMFCWYQLVIGQQAKFFYWPHSAWSWGLSMSYHASWHSFCKSSVFCWVGRNHLLNNQTICEFPGISHKIAMSCHASWHSSHTLSVSQGVGTVWPPNVEIYASCCLRTVCTSLFAYITVCVHQCHGNCCYIGTVPKWQWLLEESPSRGSRLVWQRVWWLLKENLRMNTRRHGCERLVECTLTTLFPN